MKRTNATETGAILTATGIGLLLGLLFKEKLGKAIQDFFR